MCAKIRLHRGFCCSPGPAEEIGSHRQIEPAGCVKVRMARKVHDVILSQAVGKPGT